MAIFCVLQDVKNQVDATEITTVPVAIINAESAEKAVEIQVEGHIWNGGSKAMQEAGLSMKTEMDLEKNTITIRIYNDNDLTNPSPIIVQHFVEISEVSKPNSHVWINQFDI